MTREKTCSNASPPGPTSSAASRSSATCESVELILSLLTQGVPQETILDDYPDLEAVDIRACNAYACAVIAGDTLAAIRYGADSKFPD